MLKLTVLMACLLVPALADIGTPGCFPGPQGHPATSCSGAIDRYCGSQDGGQQLSPGDERWVCFKTSSGETCKVGGKNAFTPRADGKGQLVAPPPDLCPDAFNSIEGSCTNTGGQTLVDPPNFNFIVETAVDPVANKFCGDPNTWQQV